MKQLLLICAVVALVGGCASTPKVVPNSPEAEAAIEAVIRSAAKKHTGELTKADLEKVKWLYLGNNRITDVSPLTRLKKLNALLLGGNQLTDVSALAGLKELKILSLANNQLTDVSALAKLKELERLSLENNPELTKAEIEKLQKALPKCTILHNVRESVAAPAVPSQGVPTEGLVRMKGQCTIKYKGIFNRATSPERQIALDKALVNCIDRYCSMLPKARYEIFVKNALSVVEKNPAPYVGANTIVTEAADKTTKTFRIVVDAEVNATKLNALLEAMLPMLKEFIVNTKLVIPGGGPLVLPAIFIDGKRQQIEANVAADVKLNGVSIGFAPAVLQAPVGLSSLKVSRQGFKPYNRIINITEGLKLDLNLEMTDEGYAKWKEPIQFFQDLDKDRKMTEAEAELIKAKAEAIKKFGVLIRMDTK